MLFGSERLYRGLAIGGIVLFVAGLVGPMVGLSPSIGYEARLYGVFYYLGGSILERLNK